MGLGGGSSQPTHTTSTSVQEMSDEQKQLMALVLPEAQKFVGRPPTAFPGQTLAPITELEQQAQNEALTAAGSVGRIAEATGATQQALASDTGTVNQRLLAGIGLNPHLAAATEAATRPIIQAHERNVLPGIRGEAILTNNFGSTRQGIAEGIASEALMRSVGDTSATFANQAFRDVLGAETERLSMAGKLQTGAVGMAPQTAALMLEPSRIKSAVGGAQRADAQAIINARISKFMQDQMLPFAAAQEVAGLAFGMPAGSVSATAMGPGATQPSQARSALGMASMGAGIGGMMGGPAGAGIGAGLGALASFL